jgi:hypothetical protein
MSFCRMQRWENWVWEEFRTIFWVKRSKHYESSCWWSFYMCLRSFNIHKNHHWERSWFHSVQEAHWLRLNLRNVVFCCWMSWMTFSQISVFFYVNWTKSSSKNCASLLRKTFLFEAWGIVSPKLIIIYPMT